MSLWIEKCLIRERDGFLCFNHVDSLWIKRDFSEWVKQSIFLPICVTIFLETLSYQVKLDLRRFSDNLCSTLDPTVKPESWKCLPLSFAWQLSEGPNIGLLFRCRTQPKKKTEWWGNPLLVRNFSLGGQDLWKINGKVPNQTFTFIFNAALFLPREFYICVIMNPFPLCCPLLPLSMSVSLSVSCSFHCNVMPL